MKKERKENQKGKNGEKKKKKRREKVRSKASQDRIVLGARRKYNGLIMDEGGPESLIRVGNKGDTNEGLLGLKMRVIFMGNFRSFEDHREVKNGQNQRRRSARDH